MWWVLYCCFRKKSVVFGLKPHEEFVLLTDDFLIFHRFNGKK